MLSTASRFSGRNGTLDEKVHPAVFGRDRNARNSVERLIDTSILSSLKITDATNLCLVPLMTDQLAEAVSWNADLVCYLLAVLRTLTSEVYIFDSLNL